MLAYVYAIVKVLMYLLNICFCGLQKTVYILRVNGWHVSSNRTAIGGNLLRLFKGISSGCHHAPYTLETLKCLRPITVCSAWMR